MCVPHMSRYMPCMACVAEVIDAVMVPVGRRVSLSLSLANHGPLQIFNLKFNLTY